MERTPNNSSKTRHETTSERTVSALIASTNTVEGGGIPPGFITRRMLRDMLGISDAELRSLSARGLLKAAKRDARGWYLYADDAPEKLTKVLAQLETQRTVKTTKFLPASRDPIVPYTTDECAAVFQLHDRGESPVTIQRATNLHPAIINVILQDHARLAGSIWITKDVLDKINKMSLPILPIASSSDLVEVLEELIASRDKNLKCVLCRKSARLERCARCAGHVSASTPNAKSNGASTP